MFNSKLLNYHAQILTEIPELLSQLVLNGKKEEALQLLKEWGTHTKVNSDIWNEAKELLKGEVA
jgi:hypothetical protein